VTSSKETIKNLMNEVNKKFGAILQPKSPDSMLILKVDGYREYFKGNYQLLAYERVRICLRTKKEKLNLILTEIPTIHVDKNFPPLFKLAENEHVDYEAIKFSSPYFWYPPVPNLNKIIEKSYRGRGDKNKYFVKVPPQQKKVPLTVFRKRKMGTFFKKSDEVLILRSGNCNYKFRFRLIGCERLCKVFNEIILGEEATDNKATQPRNVTLKKFKKKELSKMNKQVKMHGLHKKTNKKYYKEAEKIADQYDTQEHLQGINTVFANYSFNYDKMMLFKQIRFGKGSIIQYLEVQCMLYHGAELLSEVVTSKQIYFNNNAMFNEWINFKNMRYCELPKKTRLSFNIVVTTVEDVKVIIGSVSINLFDEKGKFNSGIRDLNIWPFYSIDSRLGCMKEYFGISKDRNQGKIQMNTLFSKLFIEFETFSLPMHYTSRTDEDMKNKHFSNNPQDIIDKENLIDAQVLNEDLAMLKKYLHKNPLQDLSPHEKDILFK
jgi:hypothetical protein